MRSQYLLTSTLLRFQEHYESPKFRNKVFTLEEFSDWYATTSESETMSYYSDWSGFNFPSYVFKHFLNGDFSPMSSKERFLLSLFEDIKDDFYVIGTYKDPKKDAVIIHELVHAMFYTNKEYADKVVTLLQSKNLDNIKQCLRDMGYCEEVLLDEINAYFTTGLSKQLKNADKKETKTTIPLLKALFRSQFQIDLDKKEDRDDLLKQITTIDVEQQAVVYDDASLLTNTEKLDYYQKLIEVNRH